MVNKFFIDYKEDDVEIDYLLFDIYIEGGLWNFVLFVNFGEEDGIFNVIIDFYLLIEIYY